MRRIQGIVIGTVVVLVVALAGCSGRAAPAASSGSAQPAAPAGGNSGTPAALSEYASAALPASYDNALPAGTQLALGILRLEGTSQAVTPAEAKTLLPLWQAFQGNALQSDTERNAVLKQIEGSLAADQVKAIAAMKLTNDDMRKWMEENDIQLRPAGTPVPGSPSGNLTDAQRQAFRATAEAGGGFPAGAPGNLTDAQRQSFRATVEAGGGQFPPGVQAGQAPGARGTPGAGRTGAGFRFASYRAFVGPLVKLLPERAAQ
ncbi:MAG: hypothetical protein ACM30E_07625 [Nitrososphaerales archaeon]